MKSRRFNKGRAIERPSNFPFIPCDVSCAMSSASESVLATIETLVPHFCPDCEARIKTVSRVPVATPARP